VRFTSPSAYADGEVTPGSSAANPASSSKIAFTGQETTRARHSGGRRDQSFSVVISFAPN
jgi:hypothetical protein